MSPAFAFQQREELAVGPTFRTAPDSQFDEYRDLHIGWHEAPDPIRQSDYWAAGNKVNPQARMPIPSNLAIGSKESVMEDTFHIGKLLGYLHVPMYAGAQHPSVIRANIREGTTTTYGSLYEVQGVQPVGIDRVNTPTGFGIPVSLVTPEGSNDGYPY